MKTRIYAGNSIRGNGQGKRIFNRNSSRGSTRKGRTSRTFLESFVGLNKL